jgi:sulfatase modifying factor 1
MVYVPGGTTHIGSEDGPADERPVFAATVAPFYMDRDPVTVEQFREFVGATGYRTQAERFGEAGVFDARSGRWRMTRGATWRYPFGPGGAPAPDDHPVTQVSWNDAVAFADWAGKRLPSEIEWEHAARGGRDARHRYPWGDELFAGGRPRANTMTPMPGVGPDRFLATSPVGSFGETGLGLRDLAGNVWEWTADWYRSYAERIGAVPAAAPAERSQRGGSFLCHEGFCRGYRVAARSHSTPETALFHVGFRLVQDLAPQRPQAYP